MRWTWRRLGWVGSWAMRERCWTVTPRWASPSTPRPARSRMPSWLTLLNRCVVSRLTATTVPLFIGNVVPSIGCPDPMPHPIRGRRWSATDLPPADAAQPAPLGAVEGQVGHGRDADDDQEGDPPGHPDEQDQSDRHTADDELRSVRHGPPPVHGGLRRALTVLPSGTRRRLPRFPPRGQP